MDEEIGEIVAARLKEGSRVEYEKLQNFVRMAVERQEWLYADMIMRIVWALLPVEAREKISKGPLRRERSKPQAQPPPVPKHL